MLLRTKELLDKTDGHWQAAAAVGQTIRCHCLTDRRSGAVPVEELLHCPGLEKVAEHEASPAARPGRAAASFPPLLPVPLPQ